ncbi:MAG: methylated-DNA--[protein]-cysteine S-methyltransferase [Firmicutes bacterium]|nr:methylated-DNA--[protein]-cysteine S-methyltransferase [Bacillota bacterium]
MQKKYLRVDSPIGRLTIVSKDNKLVNIFFEGEEPADIVDSPEELVLQNTAKQLREYFAGSRKVFDVVFENKNISNSTVVMEVGGGDFHKRVWDIMVRDVGFGTTTTYSDLATLANSPKACRAVGSANNRNPIPIIIPCHRVLGKGGSLTGFRWGLGVKEKLLAHEGLL